MSTVQADFERIVNPSLRRPVHACLAQIVVRPVEMGETSRHEVGHPAREAVLRPYTWAQVARCLVGMWQEA